MWACVYHERVMYLYLSKSSGISILTFHHWLARIHTIPRPIPLINPILEGFFVSGSFRIVQPLYWIHHMIHFLNHFVAQCHQSTHQQGRLMTISSEMAIFHRLLSPFIWTIEVMLRGPAGLETQERWTSYNSSHHQTARMAEDIIIFDK